MLNMPRFVLGTGMAPCDLHTAHGGLGVLLVQDESHSLPSCQPWFEKAVGGGSELLLTAPLDKEVLSTWYSRGIWYGLASLDRDKMRLCK